MKCTEHFLDRASEPVNNTKFSDFSLVGKSATTDASTQQTDQAV